MMKKSFFCLMMVAWFCSCNTANIEAPQKTIQEEPLETTQEEATQKLPILFSLTPEMRALLSPGADFAFRFFKQVSKEFAHDRNNLFISPYSLACALGMLYNGAEGETKEEIAAVMGMWDYTPTQINEYYQTLSKALLDADTDVELGVANAIWSDTPYPVKQEFVNLSKTYYDAEVRTMDFSLSSSLQAINNWANEKTKGTIPIILKKLEPPMVMVLANAVYFKSPWTVPFEKPNTVEKPFYNSNGTLSTVQMMHQKELSLQYAHTLDYEFVILPYANETFSMSILLPKEGKALEEVIEAMDGATWRSLTATALRPTVYVTLSMPKFSLQDDLSLNNVLMAMGMSRAFEKAEFGEMLEGVNSAIQNVQQFSYIDVNEEGTEASAITVVLVEVIFSGELPPPEYVTVVVDRPFLFAITERSTGTILFMGKVTML